MENKTVILEALKRLRTLAGNFRYGGLGKAYALAQRAIQIYETTMAEQPPLFILTEKDPPIVATENRHHKDK